MDVEGARSVETGPEAIITYVRFRDVPHQRQLVCYWECYSGARLHPHAGKFPHEGELEVRLELLPCEVAPACPGPESGARTAPCSARAHQLRHVHGVEGT